MKHLGRHFLVGIMIFALASAVAFAKVKRSSITFAADTTVAGTLVKAGDYEIRFDDKTNELAIYKTGGKVKNRT